MKVILSFISLFIIVGLANADCVDLISVSKVVGVTVESQDEFESHANAFCKEYKESRRSKKKANYGGSYKFLSASMGKSGASESEVASKYCSASTGEYKRKDAYRNYVETIAPSAYKAYEKCVELSKGGINFDVNKASILPNEMSISVSYSSKTRTDNVDMDYSSSKDVQCRWRSSPQSSEKKIDAGSTCVLECSRNNINRKSYIKIFPSSSTYEPLTLGWPAYDEQGRPCDLLQNLTQRLQEVSDQMSCLSGAVVPFALDECPSGWSEYEPAYGRFIRGIDRSEGKIDPDGERAPGDLQEDDIKKHKHNLPQYIVTHGGKGDLAKGTFYGVHFNEFIMQTDDFPISEDKSKHMGDETRPQNVSLIFCVKN